METRPTIANADHWAQFISENADAPAYLAVQVVGAIENAAVELSYADVCRLSRSFNATANLATQQDYRINEWLKGVIASKRGAGPHQ